MSTPVTPQEWAYVDATPNAVAVFASGGPESASRLVLVHANQAFRTALRCADQDLTGLRLDEFAPPAVTQALQPLLETASRVGASERTQLDLPELGHQCIVSAFRLGDTTVALDLCDITAQMRREQAITRRSRAMVSAHDAAYHVAEQALFESEQKYRTLFDLSPDSVFLIDRDTDQILDANMAAVRAYGYSRAELRQLRHRDLAADPERALTPSDADSAESLPPVRLHRRKSGEVFPVEVTVSTIPFREGGAYVVNVRDISERVQAERALRVTEQRWQFALDGADYGLWDWDPAADQLAFSEVARGLIGRGEQHFTPGLAEWLLHIHADDRERVRRLMSGLVSGDAARYESEHRVLTPAGAYVWVLEHATVMERSTTGSPVRIIGTFSDISARKRLEHGIKIQRELGIALGETGDMAEALTTVLNAALELEGVDCGGVYQVDAQTGDIRLVVHRGLGHVFVAAIEHYGPDSTNAAILRAGTPTYAHFLHSRTLGNPELAAEGLRAMAVLPVCHERRLVAALNVSSHSHDEFAPGIRQALEAIAGQIGGVIARLRAEQEMRASHEHLRLEILERARVETALRQSEQRHRVLFESAASSIFLLDQATGAILDANAMASRTYGYTHAELTRMRHVDVSAEPASTEEAAGLAARDRELHIPLRWHRRKTGSVFPVEIRSATVEFEGRLVLVCHIQDISARVQVQAALDRERDVLRTLVDSLQVGVFVKDADGRFVLSNREHANYFRYGSPDSVVGKTDFDVLQPEHARLTHADEREVVRTGRPLIAKLERITRDAGDERILKVSRLPIFGEGGRLTGIVGTVEDITDRARALDALRESELRFATAFRANPVPLAIISVPDSVLLDANQGWVTLFRLDRGAAIGNSNVHADMWDSLEDRARLDDLLARTGSARDFPAHLRTATGHRFEGLVSVDLVTFGGRRVALMAVQDMTSLRQTELALRDSERRFSHLFRANPVALSLASLKDGIIVDVNDQWTRLYGVSRQDAIGRTTIALGQWPDSSARSQLVQKLLTAGSVQEAEVTLLTAAGKRVEVLVSADIVDIGGERLTLSAAQDLTALRHTERNLRDSEQRYRRLADATFEAIIVTADGLILDANERTQEMWGYDLSELVGTSVLGLVAPEYRGVIASRIETRAGHSVEVICRRKDGTQFPAEARNTQAWLSGREIRIAAVRDSSERKRAEEALRESERRHRELVEFATEGIWTADAHGTITFANPRLAQMLGYAGRDLQGRDVFELMDAKSADIVRTRAAQRTPGIRDEFALTLLRRDGTPVPALVSVMSLLGTGGENVGTLAVTVDLTAQRRAEQEHDEHIQRIYEARKLEAIGKLAGGIAHEINNTLGIILGYASLVEMDLAPTSPMLTPIRAIEDACDRGAALTGQLLGFARMGKYQPQPVAPTRLIEEVASLVRRTFDRAITVRVATESQAWLVQGDPNQLRQVLVSMAINAGDAMPNGGSLTLSASDIVLDSDFVRARPGLKAGRYVVIAVTDTGVGISPEVRERMFEPFFTTKTFGKGSGLELAAAHGIVQNHGGQIEVESEVGKGTTMLVYLPALEDRSSDLAVVAQPAPRSAGTILLVDDEEAILETGAAVLTRLGYTVLLAQTGADAIELYRSHLGEIDLVILDMNMPVKGGSETADDLIALDPHCRILVGTGYSLTGPTSDLVRSGAVGFIQKPYRVHELSQAVAHAIANPR